MSNSVEYTTVYVNMEALTDAFAALGWTIKENSARRTYSSDPRKNEVFKKIAVNPKRDTYAYDIGLVEAADKINFVWDPFGGSIIAQLGKDFCKLNKEYCLAVAKKCYDEVEIEETFEDGSLIINAYYEY